MSEKNETQKAEEQQIKNFSIAEIWGTLDTNQLYLVSWVSHTSLQKGRVMGQMEKEGKSVNDIAEKLHVDVDLIKKALGEDPFEVIQ